MKDKDYIPNYQQPSEFFSDGDIYKLFLNNNLMIGRMISGSKSGYVDMYPDHKVIFNANIITKNRGKIWHGDLDITMDMESLENISKELEEDLYILREMDARFENEDAGFKYWKDKAIEIIKYKK